MSKIEVIGPKDLLLPVLETIRRSATMQIDAAIQRRIDDCAESRLAPIAVGGAWLEERLAFETLRRKIECLLAMVPEVVSRESYLPPPAALAPIRRVIDKQLARCEEEHRRKAALEQEYRQLQSSLAFLSAAVSLVPERIDAGDLDVIAVALKDHTALLRLQQAAARLPLVSGLRSTRAADGSYIGLLTTEKSFADRLRQQLSDDQIPEVALPENLRGRPLAEKIAVLHARCDELTAQMGAIDRRQRRFAQTWRHLHIAVRDWLTSQLAMREAATLAYETAHCFVIFGWSPTTALPTLRDALRCDFGDSAIVVEKPILLRDLEQVPVALRNPPYLRPFELLVTLLPPPRYTSFDPTPLIALCFPFFFGLMVGDVGHGVILLVAAAAAIIRARPPVLLQAAWVLLAAAVFTIVFGLVFGECFGEAGGHLLGLEPRLDRRTSFVPMLAVTVGIGFLHVSLGLVLGVLSALAAQQRTEAAFRATSLLMIVALAALLVSFVTPAVAGTRRPIAVVLVLAVPVLVVSGGLVAPFELVRHVGNIVSYARLMAIGLASVLLAHVANGLATAVESIWAAVMFAVVLHTFNVVLGVFGPTIHALRLHYVEFFSKFFEPAIKRYEPLKAA
jgi:V/A-type H+-transporting ATPase subunit I